ncbi:MAG: hypothetical protein ACO24D_18290, partial [bacterium]
KSAQSQPLRSFSPLKRITHGRQGFCLKARSAASQFSSADSHGLCLPRRSAMGLICSSGIGGGDASLPGGHGPQKGQCQGGIGFNDSSSASIVFDSNRTSLSTAMVPTLQERAHGLCSEGFLEMRDAGFEPATSCL